MAKNPVASYFIELDFADIQDPEERDFFNDIPTSFVLEKEQVRFILTPFQETA